MWCHQEISCHQRTKRKEVNQPNLPAAYRSGVVFPGAFNVWSPTSAGAGYQSRTPEEESILAVFQQTI